LSTPAIHLTQYVRTVRYVITEGVKHRTGVRPSVCPMESSLPSIRCLTHSVLCTDVDTQCDKQLRVTEPRPVGSSAATELYVHTHHPCSRPVITTAQSTLPVNTGRSHAHCARTLTRQFARTMCRNTVRYFCGGRNLKQVVKLI